MYRTFASLILAAVTLVPSASAATGAPAIQSDNQPPSARSVQFGSPVGCSRHLRSCNLSLCHTFPGAGIVKEVI